MKFLISGVDVSKATLDIYILPGGQMLRISNNIEGFRSWYKEIKKQLDPDTSAFVVMEHTGSYSCKFEQFLQNKSLNYCKISALQIKRSMGLIRGKNDKVDAVRIAEYGWLRKEQLEPDVPCSKSINRLRDLLSFRHKIVRDRSGYICRIKDLKAAGSYGNSDAIISLHQRLLAGFTKELRTVEKQILALIKSDEDLSKTCELLRTIKGVGVIVAASIICCTNNFKRFSNARKFNCYAGLAPFKHESGTSIRGKARVSHLANKDIKSLLNLAACSAIRHDPELKNYYQKRVKEGMKKMCCLNIIRSKIVSRIFAVAKRQTPFVILPMAA